MKTYIVIDRQDSRDPLEAQIVGLIKAKTKREAFKKYQGCLLSWCGEKASLRDLQGFIYIGEVVELLK